ncbi:MAG: hypothetical protein ROR55_05695 [Devosia sp.]
MVLGSCIGLLLSGDVAGRVSTQSVSLQKIIEIRQSGNRCAWRADLHADADRSVEHPLREDREHARQYLDVDEPTELATVYPFDPDAPTEKRVPAVVDNSMLPDMGRMNGGRRSAVKANSSWAPE